MLGIPQIGEKPKKSDYRLSKIEIERYNQTKQIYDKQMSIRAQKNKRISNFVCILIILLVELIVFTIIENAKGIFYNTRQMFVLVAGMTLASYIVFYGILHRISDFLVDKLTDKPVIIHSPQDRAAQKFKSDLDTYERNAEKLRFRYPYIEEANYYEDVYTKQCIQGIKDIFDTKFSFWNSCWWRGNVNFFSATSRLLVAIGFSKIKLLNNDPNRFFSSNIDFTAEKDGLTYFFNCTRARKRKQEIDMQLVEKFISSVSKESCNKLVVISDLDKSQIGNEAIEFFIKNDIDLWDIKNLIELTKKYLAEKQIEENPLSLGDEFEKHFGYEISRHIRDKVLTTIPYYFYIYQKELFNSKKEALEAMAHLPKGDIYYGLIEYPNFKNYRYNERDESSKRAYYQDAWNEKPIFGIIAYSSKSFCRFRLHLESEYLYDANTQEYIRNNHNLNGWLRGSLSHFSFDLIYNS